MNKNVRFRVVEEHDPFLFYQTFSFTRILHRIRTIKIIVISR